MTEPLSIRWPEDGLVPAVIQDASSGDVLMLGFMNEAALARTRSTGYVHFWSRSRQKLWKKGETSGHVQQTREIFINCEQNSLLIEVEQTGAVCHTGFPTCYYRRLDDNNSLHTIRDRSFDPSGVYGVQSGAEGLVELWWGAYAFLKQLDVGAKSGTSRILAGETSVVPRIQDELRELAGVLDGTHVHESQHDDAILEASQICYWTVVELLRTDVDQVAVRPDRALASPPPDAEPSALTAAKLLYATAEELEDQGFNAPSGHEIFALVAFACSTLAIDPLDVIRADLQELRSRDYLASYFAR